MAEKLTPYRRKRHFAATPEPDGDPGGAQAGEARFVVQEHHATRLHWDLRLERNGVLASWAVPNGIPEDPDENRKAVHTEDHPLEYLDFEGDIPKGNYGAGKMRIWDRGTYALEKWDERHVIAEFHGERLRGRYALFRTGGEGKDWMIHRMDPPEDPDREPMPERLLPMLARLGAPPRAAEGYAWEIKWDGVRAIAYSEPGRLRFESRNLNDITSRYPEVRPLNRALSSHSAVLDGEIVAFDAEGRPSFQLLQSRMHLTSEGAVRRKAQDSPVAYVVFDLLYLDGRSLLALPYRERRRRLEELDLNGPRWQTPAYHEGDGAPLIAAARERGLEGVVAKRLDSPYEPGRRSPGWIKVKNVGRQEVVVVGWLVGEGRRKDRIGALLTGVYEDGTLRFAGKVGTGFSERELDRLAALLAPLRRDSSPFTGKQPQRGAIFAEPQLVAEVEFTEWTSEGLLRHPSYKGLRDDKDPAEVVRERAGDEEAPRSAGTEVEAATYYARIAPVMLPHVRGRGGSIEDLPSLRSWAGRAEPELRVTLAVAPDLDRPTAMVLGLEPLAPVGTLDCAEVALLVRDTLAGIGLRCLVKTSGLGGLEVYVPLNHETTYEATMPFARTLAELLASRLPDRVVAGTGKKGRKGKVLVDPSSNVREGSSVAAYSTRAGEPPSVSTPVSWAEVEAALHLGDAELLAFEPAEVLERVADQGDLFAPVLSLVQELPSL